VTAPPILLLAATPRELGDLDARLDQADTVQLPGGLPARTGRLRGRRVVLLASGIGKAAAASGVAVVRATTPLSACINVGIAGAYVGAFLPVGQAVAAASEFDLDAGVLHRDASGTPHMRALETAGLARTTERENRVAHYATYVTDEAWTARLAHATRTAAQPFATSDAISGDLDVAAERAERAGAAVESMEGAGAAHACAEFGIAFGEVRGVSNVAGVRDKAVWEIDHAVRAMSQAVLRALDGA